MSSCPPGSKKGFINFSSTFGIDFAKYEHAGPQGFPFYMNFAPRTTPITHNNQFIQEDYQNTLTYRGSVYTINSVQITKPNYHIYGTLVNPTPNIEAKATILYTFVITDQSQKNLPPVILLIVPIYIGVETITSNYLLQIQNPPDPASKPIYSSMQQLFENQPSFGYMACHPTLAMAASPDISGLTAMTYSFTNGITITEANWASLKGRSSYITNLQPYSINGRLTDNSTPLVILEEKQIPTEEKSINFITYYPMDIRAVTNNSYITDKKLLTNQYQCQPFDKLNGKDPKGKPVDLQTVITTNNRATNVGIEFSLDQLLVLWVPIAGIVVIVLGLGFVLWAFSGKEKLPPPLPTAAPAPVGATG